MPDTINPTITAMGFASLESFLMVLFIAIALLAAFVIIVAVKPVYSMFPYAYPNARLRARIGRLITAKQLSEILDSDSLEEVKNYLRGFPEYAKYVDKYSLEKALDMQLAETYDLVARIAPDSIKSIFLILLKKWDIRNIKTLITAKESDLGPEKTAELLIPFGEITDVLEKLVEAESVDDVIMELEETEYYPLLEEALPDYEKTGMILPLEANLDKYFFENLLKTLEDDSDENKELLYSYIGSQVDITNLKIVLRAKMDDLQYEDISSYLVSEGYQIRDWKLKDLMDAENVPGIISLLEGTDYGPYLEEVLSEYNKTGSIAPFEVALAEYITKTAKTLSRKKPLGTGPMIGFLSKKEAEIKNLKVIVRGKREAGFPVSKIKEMLI